MTTKKERHKRLASDSFYDYLQNELKDNKYAAVFLDVALKDGRKSFFLALNTVVEARGGVAKLAKASKLSRESLYKLLSGKRDAMFSTVNIILKSLGLNYGILSPTRKTKTRMQGTKAA